MSNSIIPSVILTVQFQFSISNKFTNEVSTPKNMSHFLSNLDRINQMLFTDKVKSAIMASKSLWN